MLITFLAATIGIFAYSTNALVTPKHGSHSCATIPAPTIPGVTILSISSQERHNYTVTAATPIILVDITRRICRQRAL
jgi:hypothetical protein